MGIETIGQEMPFCCLGVGFHHIAQMLGIVDFRSGGTDMRCDHMTGDNIQAGNQALGAMANVLKFLTLNFSGAHRQVKGFAFQGLNPGHFIGGNRPFALPGPVNGR